MTTTVVSGNGEANGSLPPPKQIRFVNNQGQPPSKRRRINAACLTCRRRKTRCAGEKPICTTCSKNGHKCLGYNDLVEKRPGDRLVKLEAEDTLDSGFSDEQDFIESNDEGQQPWKTGERKRASGSSAAAASRYESLTSASPATTLGSRTISNDWEHIDSDHNTTPSNVSPLHLSQTSKARQGTNDSDSRRPSRNRSPSQQQHHEEDRRHRVPYFRYFGPTAIVPGYKQMVVSVRDRRKSRGGSFSATSPTALHQSGASRSHRPSQSEAPTDNIENIIYDREDSGPVHPVILSLVETFFLHLGCNFLFLKPEKFLRHVKERRVEPILVDAVCALAARFSDLPIFQSEIDRKIPKSEWGHVFAHRAKVATVETFASPSVAAVQAFILMAYEGFGADQDSALWMYLGCAIRMAVDIGLPRIEGVKYQGEQDPWYTRNWSRRQHYEGGESKQENDDETLSAEEIKEIQQERIDTFWAVYILDRVISSGTGRPATFRDNEIELKLPDVSIDPATGWPAPFPAFIQIIHLYGRIADVLNKLKKPGDLTAERLRKLIQMEHDLTMIYQQQDSRLQFSVPNFQEYVKAGQGTNFILLHLWFHALIIILHQPTLLFDLTSEIHQLLPNSRELSMSSAKTIHDILAFAELIESKSYIGNPFTSQPMYIAACAFLMDSRANAAHPTSRDRSPDADNGANDWYQPHPSVFHDNIVHGHSSKPSLLTSVANQNYSECYHSLRQLHAYWGGVKYIMTALDQRSEGFWDCQTYTDEEYQQAKPAQRQTVARQLGVDHLATENPATPHVPPLAFSLTGTTNSPNTNLTLMFEAKGNGAPTSNSFTPAQPTSVPVQAGTPPGNMIYDPIRQSLPDPPPIFASPSYPQAKISDVRHSEGGHARKQRSNGAAQHTSAPRDHYSSDLPRLNNQFYADQDASGRRHMISSSQQQQQHNTSGYTYVTSPQSSRGYDGSIQPSESPTSSTDMMSAQQHWSHSGSSNSGSTPGANDHNTPRHDSHGYIHNNNNNNNHNLAQSHDHNGHHSHNHINSHNQTDFVHSGLVSGSYSYLGGGAGQGALTPNVNVTDMITFEAHDIDIGGLALPSEMVAAPWLEYLSGDVGGFYDEGDGRGNE